MKLSFDPTLHGFAFPNSFVNHVGPSIGGLHITTHGRCGGMAYAALDYLHEGMAVPANDQPPPDGTPLADYLLDRLLQSYLTPPARKFVEYTALTDEKRWFVLPGLHGKTRQEFGRITAALDQGQPVVIGVIKAESVTNIGNNHQVLAYGYDVDGDVYRLWVYDNNFPLEEVALTSYPDDAHIASTEGLGARGWFLQGYSPKVPPYLEGGTILRERSSTDLHVVHGGAAFALSAGERGALGLDQAPVTEIADGSLAWIATTPGDGTVVRDHTSTRPAVVYGGAPFALTDDATRPGEIVLDGRSLTVIDVPEGAVASLPTVPRDQTLLRAEHDGTTYRMEDGQRRPIASAAVLDQSGWRGQNVRVVPDGSLAALTMGPPINGPT